MKDMFDAFLSYAEEDKVFATELYDALKQNGFNIWYAPIELSVGDNMVESIEFGLKQSNTGILLISEQYLRKKWTKHEMSILLHQHIEQNKVVLPIWHNISKDSIDEFSPGLSNIFSLDSSIGISSLIKNIVKKLSKNASTVLVVPVYEYPAHRFLSGQGEVLLNNDDGKAATLWEFLLYSKDSDYPVYLAGVSYSKNDLLFEAAQLIPQIPDIVRNWVNEEGRLKIWEMCKLAGYNPDDYC